MRLVVVLAKQHGASPARVGVMLGIAATGGLIGALLAPGLPATAVAPLGGLDRHHPRPRRVGNDAGHRRHRFPLLPSPAEAHDAARPGGGDRVVIAWSR
jgi:hypothetical protein